MGNGSDDLSPEHIWAGARDLHLRGNCHHYDIERHIAKDVLSATHKLLSRASRSYQPRLRPLLGRAGDEPVAEPRPLMFSSVANPAVPF
jgi:hypothetical protein